MAEFYDGPHATPPLSDDGAVYLGIKNLTEAGHLDLSQVRHIAEDDFPKWTKRVEPKPGDIVFTYEATLHRYAIIPDGFRGTLGRRIALIRPDLSKIDRRYLHYYLLSPQWRRTIEQRMNVGSTVDRIPLTEFPDYPVPLPPLAHQRAVVAALAAIDDLIENNRRRIEILEEMARLIYREWFVHFRFPGHEDVDQDPSGSGAAPKSWKSVTLGTVLDFHGSGATPRGGKGSYKAEGIPLVRSMNVYDHRFEEKGLAFVDPSQAADLERVAIEPDDVLLNITGASVARCCLAPPSVVGGRVNQHVMILRLDKAKADPWLVARALAGPYKPKLLSIAGSGATREALTRNDIAQLELLLPPVELQDGFRRRVEPMHKLSQLLTDQNRVLSEARDLLLPRLISGELDVSDLDLDLDSVA